MSNWDLACRQLLLLFLELLNALVLRANFPLLLKPLVVLCLDLRQLGLEVTNFLFCLLKRSCHLRRRSALASLWFIRFV
jgi:hypothetical protein